MRIPYLVFFAKSAEKRRKFKQNSICKSIKLAYNNSCSDCPAMLTIIAKVNMTAKLFRAYFRQ